MRINSANTKEHFSTRCFFVYPICCGKISNRAQYIEIMKCPHCHVDDVKVIDSRSYDNDVSVRRRRECSSCGFRYSTVEKMEVLDLSVVKSGGQVVQYDSSKVFAGIQKACRKRPISEDDLRRLLTRIETDVQRKAKLSQVKSSQIGSIVLRHLKKIDLVAYIRFASVYRNFEDLDTFEKELQKIA